MKRILIFVLLMLFLLVFLSNNAFAQSRTVSVNLEMPGASQFRPPNTNNLKYKDKILTIEYRRPGEFFDKQKTEFKLTMDEAGYFNQTINGVSVPVNSRGTVQYCVILDGRFTSWRSITISDNSTIAIKPTYKYISGSKRWNISGWKISVR